MPQFTPFILISMLTLLNLTSNTLACKGCLNLDEYNFDKIIDRFKAVLVKFDVAYPYGDKHEVFTKFAESVAHSKDLIVAEVGVKDYGEKDNEKLAKRFGVSGKDDLPAIRLFVDGVKEPIALGKDVEFTLENLRNLVRDNTNIYIGLPGCVEELDKLSIKFVAAGDKKKVLEETESLVEKLDEDGKSKAEIYLKFMRKILEAGIGFVDQEVKRLKNILGGKVTEKKKEELSTRLNILHSFRLKDSVKEEL